MTIVEITNRLNRAAISSSNDKTQLLVVVKAIVDDMNLDSDDPTLITSRWYTATLVLIN